MWLDVGCWLTSGRKESDPEIIIVVSSCYCYLIVFEDLEVVMR